MLDAADGRLTIEFPPEAVDEPLEVRVTRKSVDDVGEVGDHDLFAIWDIKAFAIDRDMAEVHDFPASIRITSRHTQQDLEGWHPDSLKLWTLNEETQTWDLIPTTNVLDSGVVSAEVDHFSIFGSTADPAVINAPFLEAYQTDLHSGASQVIQPIEVAPGRGGLTPTVTLGYSSNMANEMKSSLSTGSWTGIGWDLSVGAIRKVYVAGPNNDRYFIDFNGASDELLLGNDGVWRTRHNLYLRIQLIGNCDPWNSGTGSTSLPAPPCNWIVTDKQGTKYFFGPDAASARFYDIYDSETVIDSYVGYELYYYRWDLQKVIDTHNNAMIIDYSQVTLQDDPPQTSQNQIWVFSSYPDKMRYNFEASLNHLAEVDFVLGTNYNNSGSYPPIQTRSDVPRELTCGSFDAHSLKSLETRFLDKIEVNAASAAGGPRNLVRRYDFSYSFTGFACASGVATSGKIELSSVLVEGKNGGDLHKMEFDYVKPTSCTESNPGRIRLLDSSWTARETFTRPLLYEAENGFGGLTTYCYTESNPTVPADKQFWSRQVASQRTLNARISGSDVMTTRYTYAQGPSYYVPTDYDSSNGEYRGFGRVTETHGASGGPSDPYTEHSYYTTGGAWDELLSGREMETQVWGVSPTQMWQQKVFTWNTRNPTGCATNCGKLVFIGQVDVYKGPVAVPNNGAHSRTQYEYDAGGNLSLEQELALDGAEAVTEGRTTWRLYHLPNNPDNPSFLASEKWIMLPQFEHVYNDVYGNLSAVYLETQYDAGWIGPGQPLLPASETAYFYDGKPSYSIAPTVGNLTGMHRAYGELNVFYQYDQYGNKTDESVPLGNTHKITASDPAPVGGDIPFDVKATSWAYDTSHVVFVDSMTNPQSQTTTYEWDKRLAFMTQQVDPNGHRVDSEPDEFGRVERVSDIPFTVNGDDTWGAEYEYTWTGGAGTNPTGVNRTWVKVRFDDDAANDFTWETHCQDGFGREYQTRKSYQSTEDSVVQTSYNEQGRVKTRSQPGSAAFILTACSSTAPIGLFYTQYEYTPLGQVETLTNPDNTTRETDFGPLLESIQDENQYRTDLRYDAFGRVIGVTEFSGSDPIYDIYAVTDYTYDVLGNLTLVDPAAGDQTFYFYNTLGQRVRMVDPDMGDWDYLYDAAGNLTEQLDARGRYVSFEYDVVNRVVKKCYAPKADCGAATPPALAATFQYDTYDSGLCGASPALPPGAQVGQLTKLTTKRVGLGDIESTWCYDGRGREAREQLSLDGATYLLKREYDLADRQTRLTYPDSEAVTTSFNPTSGLPEDLASNLTGLPHYVQSGSSTIYDPGFRPDKIRLGSGQTVDYFFDQDMGRLQTLTTGSVQGLTYDYDNAGNVRKIIDSTAPAETRWFCYDEFDRLTAVAPVNTDCITDYAYDTIGNLTRHNEAGPNWYIKYGSDYQPHAAMFVDNSSSPSPTTITRAYTYDRNGNVVGIADDAIAGGPAANAIDSDGDGCANGLERGTGLQENCGGRDPTSVWDTYDTDGSGVVALFDDIFGVAFAFGTNPDDSGYARTLDRSPPADGAQYWQMGRPDGTIDLFNDIFGVAFQFGFGDTLPDPPVPETTFEYDDENRLIKRDDHGTVTTYTYDALGRLVKKTTGATSTVYLGEVYENTGGAVTKYYWFNGRRLAMRQSGTLYYLLADHLGSTTAVLTAAGGLHKSQRYHPYGRTRSGSVLPETNKQFTGHQQEAPDLYYMKARFYDPYVGRFLQADTIVPQYTQAQSLNRYSYVTGNPLRYIDPTGRCSAQYDTRTGTIITDTLGMCGHAAADPSVVDSQPPPPPGKYSLIKEGLDCVARFGPGDCLTVLRDGRSAWRMADELFCQVKDSEASDFCSSVRALQHDAFKHCYGSALLALGVGAVRAREIGIFHEEYSDSPLDTAKDNYNNGIGADIVTSLPSTSYDRAGTAKVECFLRASHGELIVDPSTDPRAR
ncbi:MAG: flexitail domain-containing putative surface protein [Dehalococcoidia bacterium]